jgi:hypothetical protein
MADDPNSEEKRHVEEHPPEFGDQRDWGNQGTIGTFGNRATWESEREWEELAELGPPPPLEPDKPGGSS